MPTTIKTRITNRHGLGIAVQVDIPENPRGLAFIVHGWLSSMQGSSSLAVSGATREADYTTVCFDCTHSNGESDGAIEPSTISTFISDLEDVVAWAKEQNWFQSPYVLAGTSLGGITILEHARAHSDEVKAIAPICTVISGTLSIEAANRTDPRALADWQAHGFKTQEYGDDKTAQFPWEHMADRLRYDALGYAPQMTLPLFMCVGSEDTSCPPDHQRQLFDSWGGDDKKFHLVDGCPHRFHEPAHMAALKTHLKAWLGRVSA